MLRIVDVHVSETAIGEYVVLQNQGLTTVSLHGWLLCTDAYLGEGTALSQAGAYVFVGDIPVKPYSRVVLFTGCGQDGWYPTNDGKRAYVAFWGRADPVWSHADRVHLLQPACSRKIGVAVDAPPVYA